MVTGGRYAAGSPQISPRLRSLYRARVPSGRRHVHVDARTGDDDRTGLSPAAPLATIQAALDRAEPGDRILVAPGAPYAYTSAYGVHGTPDAWVSVESADEHRRAVVDVTGADRDGIDVQMSSYLGLYGIEVVSDTSTGSDNPSGVAVFRRSHHVALWCIEAHGFPGGGINCFYGREERWGGELLPAGGWDAVDVWHPVIHGCCRRSPANTSGVSFFGAEDLAEPIDGLWGYRLVGAYVTDCVCVAPFSASGLPGSDGLDWVTDGNGVSIDRLADPPWGLPAYTKPGLVDAALVAGCGGRAVHVHRSDHVRCLHTTAVADLRTASPAMAGAAELDCDVEGADVTFDGCVVLRRPGGPALDRRTRYVDTTVLGGDGPLPPGTRDRCDVGWSWFAGPLDAATAPTGLPVAAFAPRVATPAEDLEPVGTGEQAGGLGPRPGARWAPGALDPAPDPGGPAPR